MSKNKGNTQLRIDKIHNLHFAFLVIIVKSFSRTMATKKPFLSSKNLHLYKISNPWWLGNLLISRNQLFIINKLKTILQDFLYLSFISIATLFKLVLYCYVQDSPSFSLTHSIHLLRKGADVLGGSGNSFALNRYTFLCIFGKQSLTLLSTNFIDYNFKLG